MARTIGERVGAIVCGDAESVTIFGYGTYQGDEIPPPEIMGPFGPVTRPNPKLLLDDGSVAWGCECWWGSEKKIRESIGDRKVLTITPEEYRARNRKEAQP